MISIKVCLALACLFGAYSVQTAVAEEKTFDLSEILATIFNIVHDVLKAVADALDKVKPYVDELVAMLSEKLGKIVEGIIAYVNFLFTRVQEIAAKIEQEITDAQNNSKGSEECFDQVADAFDNVANKTENDLADLFDKITEEQKDHIANCARGLNDTVNVLDAAIALVLSDGSNCLRPGTKGVKDCVKKAYGDFTKTIDKLLTDVVMPYGLECLTLLTTVATEAAPEIGAIYNETLVALDEPLGALDTCIGSLKP